MKSLDDLLREAIAERRLTAINLWPTVNGWQANTSVDRVAWKVAINADPVKALREVLGDTDAGDDIEDMLG